MSVYACLGNDAAAIRDAFLTRLQSKTEDMRIKVMILEFLTVAVETQPGLIELFLNLEVKDGKEGSKVCVVIQRSILILLWVVLYLDSENIYVYFVLTWRSFCLVSGAVFMWCWTWLTPNSRGSIGALRCSTEQPWPSSSPSGRTAETVPSLSYVKSKHILSQFVVEKYVKLGESLNDWVWWINCCLLFSTENGFGRIWQHLSLEHSPHLQIPQRYFALFHTATMISCEIGCQIFQLEHFFPSAMCFGDLCFCHENHRPGNLLCC